MYPVKEHQLDPALSQAAPREGAPLTDQAPPIPRWRARKAATRG